MIFEVLRMTRDMVGMSPTEIGDLLDSGELIEGGGFPIVIDTLDQLPDLPWITDAGAQISNTTLDRIEKSLKKSRLYVGKRFIVRAIAGARRK